MQFSIPIPIVCIYCTKKKRRKNLYCSFIGLGGAVCFYRVQQGALVLSMNLFINYAQSIRGVRRGMGLLVRRYWTSNYCPIAEGSGLRVVVI